MRGQVSMFEMLGVDETPVIPFDQQKRGMKGWVIEICAEFLPENGYKKRSVGVTTYQVVLDRDSYERKNIVTDRIEQWQTATCTGVGGCRVDGWVGRPKKLFSARPKWWELQEYVRKNYREPFDEIVYAYKDGHACIHIGVYE